MSHAEIWKYRAEFFAKLINRLSYKYVYDFGCGFCEIQKCLSGQQYFGIDMVKQNDTVIFYDLNTKFPSEFKGEQSQRIAIALGLLEYLDNPVKFINDVLQNFDSFYFTYFHITDPNYNKIIATYDVMQKNLITICKKYNKKIEIRGIINDPFNKDGTRKQDVFLVKPKEKDVSSPIIEIVHEDVLLAIIDDIKNFAPGLSFYGKREDNIQVGQFCYGKGKVLRNHRHIERQRIAKKTQEILIVMQGSCEARTFAPTGKDLIDTRILKAGSFYVSYNGGVGFTVLEDDTRMLEIKNGPFIVNNDDEERELL
jgi:hypothetical protein